MDELKLNIIKSELAITNNNINLGENLIFQFNIELDLEETKLIRIDYGICFIRANGSYLKKIFRLSEKLAVNNKINVIKRHPFKDYTTRKHYSGKHQLFIMINGTVVAEQDFNLFIKN